MHANAVNVKRCRVVQNELAGWRRRQRRVEEDADRVGCIYFTAQVGTGTGTVQDTGG